ncbi:hypothetical protein EJ08DRAFT_491389 [Tothia fuscella]|uniref:Cytoplasmic tRNA 2-thiolation protein 2 n=1 Tax=Tothia fuscella TaxID=1048955 RepID=A0A9P4NHR4_9PEZI|nr:hypothetical protein EJ08DRAFT_491389 [Tothia fuscella]
MPAKHIGAICRRCNILEATLTVRSDPLCRDCFVKYVHTKVIKRMEAFRTRHSTADQTRVLLLPVSFGVSSITLLHILDGHLKAQNERTGRKGFALHVLFVEEELSTREELEKKVGFLKERYGRHEFSSIHLSQIFKSGGNSDEISQTRMEALFSTIKSATSLTDVAIILRTRLIVQFAQDSNCEGILWGDSTTKLAEKVLSETAKGRGFTLPWQVADGMSPYGIPFYYPMRDVLKKEIIAHLDLVSPPLSPLLANGILAPTIAPPSAKNTTIDILMRQYFESVEESYPSIVSNVVRTTSKLQAPLDANISLCKLCKLPVNDDKLGIHGWGGDQAILTDADEDRLGLCYGCSRAVGREGAALLP